MRQLASIQQISDIQPIPNKDRIVLATVEGWKVIVRKDDFKVGDLCVYIEIDSVLPEKPEFEFLRPKKFRIKTIKMGSAYSQGICFPLYILPPKNWKVGDDVTDIIGVKHYDEYLLEKEAEAEVKSNQKPDPLRRFLFKYKYTRWLAKRIYISSKKERCGYPTFISKTDEERIQNMPQILKDKTPRIVTEKIDGTSGTFFVRKNKGIEALFNAWDFGVCTRNWRLSKNNSAYWRVAEKYHMKDVLIALAKELNAEWVCIQGEIIGPGVQGNHYNRDDYELYCFNLITPDKNYPDNPMYNNRMNSTIASSFVYPHGLKWVPLLDNNYILPDTVDEMLAYADGKSVLADTFREGVVIRTKNGNGSFKAVSNRYLMRHQDEEYTPVEENTPAA